MRTGEFEPGEIAVVCARYDLRAIVRADPLGAGSTGAPKVVLTAEDRRRYLLKRREPGRNDLQLVTFTHEIQASLARHRYPVAPLLSTRDGQTMVALDGHVYELFEFIEGQAYDRSAPATRDAGRALAYFHRILAKHLPTQRPARATYHDAPFVRAAIDSIARAHAGEPVRMVAELYEQAAAEARERGMEAWPTQIIHADWHPGNLRFRRAKVAAVLDYDSARMGLRAVDVANGALQFSLTTGGADPASWPQEADLERLAAFCSGYESVRDCVLSRAEVQVLPWLMVEAIIGEAVVPIAREGRFGGYDAQTFLAAVRRKASWLAREHLRIVERLNV